MNKLDLDSQTPGLQKLYAENAAWYAAAARDKSYNAHYERPAILSLLPDVKGKEILDIACGPGFHAEWMADRGARVTAVDVSPQMIELVRERLGQRVQTETADLSQPLDFGDATFDIVHSSLTLHYIRDLTVPFGEFNRILRPSGRFVFSMHHPFVDHQARPEKNYFTTELVEEKWKFHGKRMSVQFYIRPLSAIFNALAQANFWVENVVEPMPTITCKEKYPDTYQKLSVRPQFLFVRAQKKT